MARARVRPAAILAITSESQYRRKASPDGDRHREGCAGRRHSRRHGDAHQCKTRGTTFVPVGHQRRRRLRHSRTSPPTPTPCRSRCPRSGRLKRSGRRGQPGRARRARHAHHRRRRRAEDGHRHGRDADRSGRRAASGRSPIDDRIGGRTCRSPTAATTRCSALAPGRQQPARQPDAGDAGIGGGGDGNFMLDGSTDDGPGRQPADARGSASRRSPKCEVADVRLPGRVRPLERPADQRRHQERHEPVPRLALRRRAQLDWNANSQTNILNGDPKTVPGRTRLGLRDRRSGRQAGRQQQAVLLLQPGIQPAHRAATTSRVTGMPTRARTPGRFLAVDRQHRQPVSLHQGSAADRRVQRDDARPAASRTAACSARSRRTGSIRPG